MKALKLANKRASWPRKIKSGNSVVTVYREVHKTYAAGYRFKVWWTDAGRPTHETFSDEEDALREARLKADQLNAGRVEGASMTQGDRDEIRAAREITGAVPVLSALKEWARARDLTQGHIIAAAEAWNVRNVGKFTPILIENAVDEFIKAKDKLGKQGTRTYGSKLKPLKEKFSGRELHTLTAMELDKYLDQWEDGVTRNDFRKRAVALWRWAYKKKRLPHGVPIEIEQTDRADEKPTIIGILTPDVYRDILEFFRANHPKYLAAVVVAGFCGVRSDEIHGKRANREIRQTWEDLHMTASEPYLNVSNAKTNTPSRRTVPLCKAAITWLSLIEEKNGPICEAGAMEMVRRLAIEAGFKLPDNCFRHSFITYRIDITKNKGQVALEAGNSEEEIDARYRAHIAPGLGERWFSAFPGHQDMTGKIIAHA